MNWWIVGAFVFGVYAAYCNGVRAGHAYASVRYRMRIHSQVSAVLCGLCLFMIWRFG